MAYLLSQLFRFQLLAQGILVLLMVLLPQQAADELNYFAALLLLVLVGIPHGANDFLYREQQSTKGAMVFLGFYLGTMLLYTAIWWFWPLAALLLFFLISVHHFGQSNFETNRIWSAPALLWGGWLLLAPIAIHPEESFQIFHAMVGGKILTLPSNTTLVILRWGLWSIYLIVALLTYRKAAFQLVTQALLVGIWFEMAPLIPGFIVVFGLWHSSQSMHHQWVWYKAQRPSQHPLFWKNLGLFSALTFLILAIIAVWVPLTAGLLFILLSIVTLPHVLVMNKLYRG